MKYLVFIFLALTSVNINALEIEHEMGTTVFNETPKTIVALDWVLTETLIGIDVQPSAIADINGYKNWVTFPEIPDNIVDVGDRREPNLELITSLKPDVILMNKQMASSFKQLNAIAPTVVYSVFSDEREPLEAAKTMTRQLGKLFDKNAQAQKLISETDQLLISNGQLINQSNVKPLMFIRFLDQKTMRVHSKGSLVNDTIEKMGLTNSWEGNTNIWGFSKIGIESFAEHQDSRIMIFGPLQEEERQQLFNSPLWQAMKFSKEDSYHEMPAIWTFGGLLASQRFSQYIADTLAK